MKKLNKTLLSASTLMTSAIATMPAMAHVGDHSEHSVMSSLMHFITEPDHLLISGVVAVALVFVVRRLQSNKV